MHIKQFEGSEMSGILRAIKLELGPNAVILSTQEVSKKKAGLLCRPIIQVTAAVDSLVTPSSNQVFSKTLRAKTPEKEPAKKSQKEGQSFEKTLDTLVQKDLYQELKEIRKGLEDIRKAPQAKAAALPPEVHETWLEMKVMLKALRDMQQADPQLSKDQNLRNLYQQLLRSGFDLETAKSLSAEVAKTLSQEAIWQPSELKGVLHELLERRVEVTGPFGLNRTGYRGPLSERGLLNVVSLVGPTGVGKTTTTAKIAVSRLRQNERAKLVAFDPEGEEHGDTLLHFAERFGIPALKVHSWDRLQSLLSKRKPGELILVDTAGRSHLDERGVAILRRMALIGVPIETHLVLSANIKEGDLSEMIDRFSVLSLRSLIFTKLDETTSYGSLFSAIGRKKKALSYLTDGQRVPDDIAVATPGGFADLLLAGRQAHV